MVPHILTSLKHHKSLNAPSLVDVDLSSTETITQLKLLPAELKEFKTIRFLSLRAFRFIYNGKQMPLEKPMLESKFDVNLVYTEYAATNDRYYWKEVCRRRCTLNEKKDKDYEALWRFGCFSALSSQTFSLIQNVIEASVIIY